MKTSTFLTLVASLSLWVGMAAFADNQSFPDSMDPHALTPAMIKLKLNATIDTDLILGNPKNKHQANCKITFSGANAFNASDEVGVYEVAVSTQQRHVLFSSSVDEEIIIGAAEDGHQLNIDCNFPSDGVTLGDLRKMLNDQLSIIPTSANP